MEWLRLGVQGEQNPDHTPVFSNEAGEPIGSFRSPGRQLLCARTDQCEGENFSGENDLDGGEGQN